MTSDCVERGELDMHRETLVGISKLAFERARLRPSRNLGETRLSRSFALPVLKPLLGF